MKNSYPTVTDQFCGFGGSSIGAAKTGADVRLALNHWKLAVEVHNSNFPNTDHDCTDISAVDPRRYPSTDILITSPECTNHSLAKGKPRRFYTQDLFGNSLIDPSEERSRATMWDVPRFAEYHDYNIIIVENVVDAGKWRLFDAWLTAMHALDYDHEVVYLNSMFAWPTPQSRDRMYTVFWKRGNRRPNLDIRPLAWCQFCEMDVEAIQTWKKIQHWGRYKAQYFYRCPVCTKAVEPYYYAAFNAIDWSIQAERIGDRKIPLRPKTLARIQYGLEAYGRQPIIISTRYSTGIDFRVKPAFEFPMPTQPGDVSQAVVFPWLVETGYTDESVNRAVSAAKAYPTQTARQSVGLAMPFLVKTVHSNNESAFALGSADTAMWTQTTCQDVAVVAPGFLVRQNSIEYGRPERRSIPLDRPAGTITTEDTTAMIGILPSFIAELHGTTKAGAITDPLMCMAASAKHHALISTDAFLTYYYNTQQASGMHEPVHTMTGLDRAALVANLKSLTVDDLTFRMLRSHEVGAAMAFPAEYKTMGTERDKVKGYGNAVTPPAMEILFNRCLESLR
jgi:DNA (cytosine-5)-methyltransferase 1